MGFVLVIAVSQTTFALAKAPTSMPEPGTNCPKVFSQDDSGVQRRRRRRVRGDWGRRRHRGIGHEYKEAGLSVGHGGRRFGKHMRHGRPLHAGGAFGRGMGGFGKHFGKGTARVGKRIAKH
jgi:hypothetical protein